MIAIITGASSGIGREIARILARDYDLVLVARREERLAIFCEELNQVIKRDGTVCRAVAFPCDVSQSSECHRLYEAFRDQPVEILVNGAGLGGFGQICEVQESQEMSMLDVNIRALHLLTKFFIRDMIERKRGYILNIASSAAYMPGSPFMATYYASKSYVLSFSRSIAYEPAVKNSGVYVGSLCPGPVATEFHQVAGFKGNPGGMSPKKCAEYAVKMMFRRKKVIIPGFFVKFTYFGAKILPAGLLLKLAEIHQIRKSKKG